MTNEDPQKHPVFERCDFVIDARSSEHLPSELLDQDVGDGPGGNLELSDGSVVKYNGVYKRRDLAGTDAVMLSLEAARDVGLGMFAAWAYEKLSGKRATISTPRGSINITDDLDGEELRQVLEVLLEEADEDE